MTVTEDLEEIILDCGFVHFEIPADGPGSTYVVMIVPHSDRVYADEDGTSPGRRLGYRGEGLDSSCAVRIYAVPDSEVSAEDRKVLRRADGADLSRYDEYEEDESPVTRAALLVSSWVGEGKWSDHLAFVYLNDPLNYAGPGAPDRPTAIVTVMLPADVYDELADVY